MRPKSRIRNGSWMMIITVLLLLSGIVKGQGLVVTGTVKDSVTGAQLQNISVYFKNTHGVRTDSAGMYFLQSDDAVSYIEFSSVGYRKLRILIKQDTGTLELNVVLHPLYNQLSTVTITRKNKARYTNKNNPAVDLIRNVIDHKSENRMEGFSSSSYEKYEKLQVSLSNLTEKLKKNRFTRKFGFVFDNADTSKIEGQSCFTRLPGRNDIKSLLPEKTGKKQNGYCSAEKSRLWRVYRQPGCKHIPEPLI